MIVKSIHVKNFRSIRDETLHCAHLTALVGANGSGKSSLLKALDLFYSAAPKLIADDFYNEDATSPVEITISYSDLDLEARKLFESYIENDELTVTRVLAIGKDGKLSATLHGSMLQNLDFSAVRAAAAAREATERYNQVRAQPAYADLPTVRAREAALDALRKWEIAHPNNCVRARDDGRFFGFTEVGQGYLGRFTRFIHVPAVRDAAEDAAEGKTSAITEIMDLVVRSVLAGRNEIQKLRAETQAKYDELVDPAKIPELRTLEESLTGTLQTFIPDASVSLFWVKAAGIEIPLPRAEAKLVEDGFRSAVGRTGHGMQRAFILTMLQHLVLARSSVKKTEQDVGGVVPVGQPKAEVPNLMLAIEEPELYQHPNRQRHLAKVLLELSAGSIAGVARKTQVIYGTHSPLFVGLDRFDQVRLLRKVVGDGGRPKTTKIVQSNLDDVAENLWNACGRPQNKFTGDSLRPRLQALMTPWMNEGFFADVVVLVEGEDDRAAIVGVATASGFNLEALGVSVIPCMGKPNIDRPLVIFSRMGIPIYTVWDGDEGEKDARPEANRLLLRLIGEPEEDFPDRVTARCCCFKRNLETTLRAEIGADLYDALINDVVVEMELAGKKDAMKNPAVFAKVVEKARAKQASLPTIEEAIRKIVALAPRQGGK